MGNQNQYQRRLQGFRFGERYGCGRHKHGHRRESLGSTHGCTPHVGSILKLCLEEESGSASQDPPNGNRAELTVRLDPSGFIDRLRATANLNSDDENNETGKMGARSPPRTGSRSRDPPRSPRLLEPGWLAQPEPRLPHFRACAVTRRMSAGGSFSSTQRKRPIPPRDKPATESGDGSGKRSVVGMAGDGRRDQRPKNLPKKPRRDDPELLPEANMVGATVRLPSYS